MNVNQLATNINIHEPFWESMNVVARELTSKSPARRRRAARAIRNLKQAKL